MYDFLHVIVDCRENALSIGRIEQDIQRIKKGFSEISPGRTTKAETVQEKKGSSSIIIWAVVVVLIIGLAGIAIFLF